MHLLLTSAGFKNGNIGQFFLSILPKPPEKCSVLMLAYPQNDEEQLHIDESKRELSEMGITNIVLYELRYCNFKPPKECDIIYVCGGNTFSILQKIKDTPALEEFLRSSVMEAGTIYVGVSAGSIIAGPDIEIAGWGSEGDKNKAGLEDMKGLEFTQTSIFPHFRQEMNEEFEHFRGRTMHPIIKLTDEEALYVNDTGNRMIK